MNTPEIHNTAIYGGAFNPPTLGHKQVVEGVLESGIIDRIIFTPDGARPDKNFGISLKEREEIIEIFFSELQDLFGAHIDISRHFLSGLNGDKINTYHINRYFEEALGYMPYQIFGSDIVPAMEAWGNNPDRFAQEKLKKIFIERPGYNFSPEGIANFELLHLPKLIEVSSTTLREMLAHKQAVEHLLTPEVHKHITENNVTYNS